MTTTKYNMTNNNKQGHNININNNNRINNKIISVRTSDLHLLKYNRISNNKVGHNNNIKYDNNNNNINNNYSQLNMKW